MQYKGLKCAVALMVLMCITVVAGFGRNHDDAPSVEEVSFAERVSGLLLNELLAALFQEFNETTPENVEEGKHAISLIFNNANRDMRLISIFPPLLGGLKNLPSDSFERKSLAKALQGEENTAVERIGGRWFYRRSIALSNTFHQSCVLCHTNFTPAFFAQTHNPGQWVGALLLRVPITEDE